MSLKTFVFGHKRYCVLSDNPDTSHCIDKCFSSMEDARAYRKKTCKCYIQKRTQRGVPHERSKKYEPGHKRVADYGVDEVE